MQKILLHTNNPKMLTGLAQNGRELMKYFLSKGDKYKLVYYCSQTNINDPVLGMMPCKAYGCIPNDPNIINQLNQDPGRARDVSYGSMYIDEIIKNEKPDIYIGSDDAWSFNGLHNKPWWKKINSILHITIDSKPVHDECFNQAKNTKTYLSWNKFGMEEMKRYGAEYAHVGQMYGCMDTSFFAPITREEKLDLRRKFGIDPKTTIFFYLSRNQLRKGFPHLIEAFAAFKKDFPNANAKLHYHTSYSEKSMGWDIPKLMTYWGVKKEDVLCTYVCKNCGQWHVKPYDGEDIDCMYCGAKKSMTTPTIQNGVLDEEMKYLYGLADAAPIPMTSGGLEYQIPSTMLCGIPSAITNYSSGEDFASLPFVHRLNFSTYYEAGSNFIKSTTSINSIKNFMALMLKMPDREKQAIGEKSRNWAIDNFSTNVIGEKWEKIFNTFTPPNWSSISLNPESKNPNYPMPEVSSDDEFITLLYKNILKMDEPQNGSGHTSWISALKQGKSREEIYKYFQSVALGENSKNNTIEFSSLIDKTDKKRILFLIKESIGDIIICSSLFESIHKKHPDHDLYVMADIKYHEILEGNSLIHKILPYVPAAEQEMQMCGVGQKRGLFDVYYAPGTLTQHKLGYLFQP